MKLYKQILFSAIISLFLCGLFTNCSQTGTRLLKKAYRKNSTELLNQFFRQWQQENPTITDAELATYNDTIQEAYKVFKAFYKANQLDSIGGSEWGNDVYKNAKYLIVQNELQIYFTDTIKYNTPEQIKSIIYPDVLKAHDNDSSKANRFFANGRGLSGNLFTEMCECTDWYKLKDKILVDSIMNFRPQINCGNKIPLYYDQKFIRYIDSFLKNSYYPLGTFGISSPAMASGESAEKKVFLENFIKIFYGHWGGYWQISSYPDIYYFTFDKRMHFAVVEYRMIYEGGAALMEKRDGKWVIVTAQRTWIQ
jgi:hypothetical protein